MILFNGLFNYEWTLLKGMCYSHFGNGVRNGASISIMQWGFLNDNYKVNPVGQWQHILITVMGFAHAMSIRIKLKNPLFPNSIMILYSFL